MRKDLNFPFYPFLREGAIGSDEFNTKLEMQREQFLNGGFIIDEEHNVFINPELGAFFWNTDSDTIEEDIAACEKICSGVIGNMIFLPEVFIDLNAVGYHFVIGGPSSPIYGLKHGIYCTNYKEMAKRFVK